MFKLPISKNRVDKALEEVSNWDDWESLRTNLFHADEWPLISLDVAEKLDNRPDEMINGTKWHPLINSYDIDPLIQDLYDYAVQCVFEKLEPDQNRENKKHPELFGKQCNYCNIWTKDYSQVVCPKCNRETRDLPLNE